MNLLKLACKIPFKKQALKFWFKPKESISYSIFDLQFPNRVGLGAGFDKNAMYLNELEALGFGFVEIGTVTPLPQAGNDKPRLFRLPKDKALVNRMGFNNEGVEAVAKRLKKWRLSQEPGAGSRQQLNSELKTKNSQLPTPGSQLPTPGSRLPTHGSRLPTPDSRLPTPGSQLIIGGNIGKNKITPNEDAWKDYETCFTALHEYVDYFVVNVSSPNTPGLRELQEKAALHKILTNLQSQNLKYKTQKPILLKIAPDLTMEQIDDVISLAIEIKLDGLVACNTTISRDQLATPGSRLKTIGAGGLSGLPVKARSTEIVRYIHQKTSGQIPVIASGGIFTGSDAKEKIDAGASLVQVWTGFVYEGPGIVKNICKELDKNGQ